jgi:hypothetical protein
MTLPLMKKPPMVNQGVHYKTVYPIDKKNLDFKGLCHQIRIP